MTVEGLPVERSEPWMREAACIGINPKVFYPGRGEDAEPAKTICRACPSTAECLNYAIENRELYGVWGGKSENQRRKMRGLVSVQCVDCGEPLRPRSTRCRTCEIAHRRAYKNTWYREHQ